MYTTTARMMEVGRMDSFALRQQRIQSVEALAKQAGLTAVCTQWRQLHKESEGEGTAVCHDRVLIESGEGIFWHESTKEPGKLFLMSGLRAAVVLERHLNGRNEYCLLSFLQTRTYLATQCTTAHVNLLW